MRRAAVGLACLITLAACSSTDPGGAASTPTHTAPRTSSTTATPTPATPATSPPPSTPPTTPSSTAPATTGKASPTPRLQLPGGGRHILGHVRVVAYYGVPGNATLGVLGSGSPEQVAPKIAARAAGFNGYGLPVQPAMELITTVAQASPGADGTYSRQIPDEQITRYLQVAHAHKMLLILDLQPGRASFLEQAKPLRRFLLDPSVHLALDPEWKVGPGQKPGGGRIGSAAAAGINEVGSWLSALVSQHNLPDKLLIVHEFTPSMLPDRQDIIQHRGVEMVLHADGFGTVASKIGVFHRLAFPHPPFGIGFKLFLVHDARLMSPAEVMALSPRPDVITYQ